MIALTALERRQAVHRVLLDDPRWLPVWRIAQRAELSSRRTASALRDLRAAGSVERAVHRGNKVYYRPVL